MVYSLNSLNNHLLSGPDLLNNLTGVLLRFRQQYIALICDIEQMFHQFHVYEAYLRFLWWRDGDLRAAPQEFRMKVHLFGSASSPGCANYGLKQLAKDNESLFPLGSQFIMKDLYVDDGVTSIATTDNAILLAKESQELCAMGGLRLHKFVYNNRSVLESIPPSEHATEVKALDLAFNDSTLERALGIHWHIESDTFRFCVFLKHQPETRRGIYPKLPPFMTHWSLSPLSCSQGKRCFRKCVGTGQTGMILFPVNCNQCKNAVRMILQIWRKSLYHAAMCLLTSGKL